MNIIEFLREKLTPGVIEKIGSFLGESGENVETAIQSALPTMLGGLIQRGTTEDGATKIMDIIKDGGHTGDILRDLPDMLNNTEKTQLLVTIGSNIFNHFFGNTAPILTEKIAGLSGIRKSSSALLLGLTAPLVLGTIGHVVHKENLGITGLMDLLNEQRDNVSKALPSTIAPHLPLRAIATTPINTAERTANTLPPDRERVAKEREKTAAANNDSLINKFFPWLMLSLLALATAYYMFFYNVTTASDGNNIGSDSTENIGTSPSVMNDSSPFETDEERFGTIDQQNSDEIATTTLVPPQKVADQPNKEAAQITPKTPVATTPERSSPKRSKSSDNQLSSKNKEDGKLTVNNPVTTKQLDSQNWTSVSAANFRSNSAELQDKSSVNSIVSYLKANPKSSLVIAPTTASRVDEDRAYAIREQLIQNGIIDGRISVAPPRGGNGILVKINQ